MVRLTVGPLEVVRAVSQLRKSGLAVRPPMAENGTPAISAAPEVWAEIEEAAVAGDPVAREHVLRELLMRQLTEPEPEQAPPKRARVTNRRVNGERGMSRA